MEVGYQANGARKANAEIGRRKADEAKAEEAQDCLDAVALSGAGDADAARVRKILRDDRKAAGARRPEEKKEE